VIPKILVSAGEASGDLYTAHLVTALRKRMPGAEFFGCAGPRMRQAGVRGVVDAASLSVVGLVEVVRHIPRIYGEYRRMREAARSERPDLAILTDSPDFHLPLSNRLRRMGVPVVYLVAPQAWAWRPGRLRHLRRVSRLLCLFPFEEDFFRRHQVPAVYIGHPLTRLVRPSLQRQEFFGKHRLPPDRPLIVLLPGSREGEIERHLGPLVEAVGILYRRQALTFILATPAGGPGAAFFRQRISGSPIQVIEGETWDAIAHAGLALAASGTVTIEAAILGTPMVTYYRVAPLSWRLGRRLVWAPYLTMVNLVAGRAIVTELMQNDMTGPRLAEEATRLLADSEVRSRMRRELEQVKNLLATSVDPIERAADLVIESFEKELLNVSR